MTTVVFDGYHLVADRRSSKSNTYHTCINCNEETMDCSNNTDKIIVPKKPLFFKGEKIKAMACSGSAVYRKTIMELKDDVEDLGKIVSVAMNFSPPGRLDFEMLIITEVHCYKVRVTAQKGLSARKYVIDENTFCAIGSGYLLVKAARKEFGYRAKECIEFASKYDPGTSKETTSGVYKPYPDEVVEENKELDKGNDSLPPKVSKPTSKRKVKNVNSK